jgi:hypothetical protein
VSRVCREIWAPGTPVSPKGRALAAAIGVTFTMTTLFFAAMGFYAPRLIWELVPPLLMLIAVDGQAIRLARPAFGSIPVRIGVTAVCLAHVLILASRFGPYK